MVDKVSDITLYLYPFGVEFVGISGLFFYDMYNKIGNMFLEVIYYQDRNIEDNYNFSWFDTRKVVC